MLAACVATRTGVTDFAIDVPFTVKNDVIETSRAKAHGPALGMTAEGWVNLGTNSIGLRGTLDPERRPEVAARILWHAYLAEKAAPG